MAKNKPAPATIIINEGKQPTAGDPHSWLPLLGDRDTTKDDLRILYGVLRPVYRGWTNSAAAFARAKLQPISPPGQDPWAITAARAEVLLPAGADDRFAFPQELMKEIDAPEDEPKPALLAYATFTWPAERLHSQYELVRGYLCTVVRELACPVLLVQHAPNRRRSDNPPHCHALLGVRKLTSLGQCGPIPLLCGDKGRQHIVDSFAAFRAGWPA